MLPSSFQCLMLHLFTHLTVSLYTRPMLRQPKTTYARVPNIATAVLHPIRCKMSLAHVIPFFSSRRFIFTPPPMHLKNFLHPFKTPSPLHLTHLVFLLTSLAFYSGVATLWYIIILRLCFSFAYLLLHPIVQFVYTLAKVQMRRWIFQAVPTASAYTLRSSFTRENITLESLTFCSFQEFRCAIDSLTPAKHSTH